MPEPDEQAPLRKRSADPLRAPLDDGIPVVGIGASAGGIDPLERFFEAAPSDSGMAFVVVLHLDPERDSRVDDILGRHAPFPAIQVTEPVDIEPDRVYVIAPHTQLEIEDDRLVPRSMPEERPRNPVDAFFRSLSEHRGAGAVGVVLSGTGEDGTLGLRSIRETGGLTVAQEPDEAGYAGMPRSAIASGSVELVLPASEIPSRLAEIRRAEGLGIREVEEEEELATAEEPAIGRIVGALADETERSFESYKRSTFLRRVDRRMKFNQVADLEEYARKVEADPEECRALVKDLLISVSRFFRNDESWEALQDRVVPELFDGKGSEDSVRVWVPGCATGEEAYSVAMLLHEHAATLAHPPEIQVFATDIDEEALQFGRKAIFPESIESDVGEERVDRFFVAEGDHHKLARRVRESVLFASHDLLSAPPFSRLDLVCCRNLLIYLKPDAQRVAVQRMHYGLREGGHLFVGASESVGAKHFEPVSTKHRIYRRKPGSTSLPLSDRSASPSLAARPERRRPSGDGAERRTPRDLHSKLLARVGLPSVLVNADYKIVHISQGAGVYLQHDEGELTDDVLELAHEPIELELRTALFRAFHDRAPSRSSVTVEVDGHPRRVDLDVRPGPKGEPLEGFAVIVFNERTEEEPDADGKDHPQSASDRIIAELEEELRKTKQHLRTTLEERDATIEELQSANEELQSINEEQQATSEELEARREELQSMNEELSTINQEHRRKIEELDEVNADLRNLMASAEIPTVFLNRDLEVRRFTALAAETFNLKSQDEGRDFSDITHRLQGVGDLTDECRSVLRSGETVQTEARTEDGRWYSVRVHPYRDTEDGVDGVVITLYDLTDRKRFEDELRRAKRYAEQIVETLHEALLVLTPDLRVKTANAAFYEQFEVAPEETAGQLIYELGNGQWDIPVLRKLLEDVLPDDDSFTDFEVEHEFEHIGPRVMLLNGRRLEHTQLILLGIRDITERRRERQERHAAEAANRAKSDFMATVSHELRTPLNAIIGYTELVLEGVPADASPEVEEQVTRIGHAAHHLRELISEVLSFSRLEGGGETARSKEVSVQGLIDEVRAVAEPLTEEAGLDLSLDADDAPSTVRTDPRKLRQILLNLLGNAVKFTDEGRVSLRIFAQDGAIRFQISDTGPGIEPEQQEQLFEPFWQGRRDEEGLEFSGGTGLGLTICQRYAEMLGGDLSVESTPGEGSTFTLRLSG